MRRKKLSTIVASSCLSATQHPRYKLPKWHGLPKTKEAYKLGSDAQLRGLALSGNPFFNFPTRQAWFAGYLDAEKRIGADAVVSTLMNRRESDLKSSQKENKL